MDEWRKRDEELAELKKKLDAAEKRAEEAEARATIEAIAEAVSRDNERTKSGRYSGRAKRMADEFRKLKTKPIVILDADGKPTQHYQTRISTSVRLERTDRGRRQGH
jgi:hypothetical protein